MNFVVKPAKSVFVFCALFFILSFHCVAKASDTSAEGVRISYCDPVSGLRFCSVEIPQLRTKDAKIGIFSIRGTTRVEAAQASVNVYLENTSSRDCAEFARLGEKIKRMKCVSTWKFLKGGVATSELSARKVISVTKNADGSRRVRFSGVKFKTDARELSVKSMTIDFPSKEDGAISICHNEENLCLIKLNQQNE
jgi:hypothetical protein